MVMKLNGRGQRLGFVTEVENEITLEKKGLNYVRIENRKMQ